MKETHKYACSCGRVVERMVKNLRSVSCFNCTEKRKRDYANTYVKHDRESQSVEKREEMQARVLRQQELRKRTKEMTEEARKEREFTMVDLRIQGFTLEQIARAMEPRLTRERVRQILARVTAREGIVFNNQVRVRSTKENKPCKFCGEPISVYGKRKEKEVYHRACYKSRWVHEDGTRMDKAEILRIRYATDPERRRKQKILMRRRYDNIMANPELKKKHRDREKVYAKTWFKKKMEDPAYKEKYLQKMRVYQNMKYARLKENPEKYAAFKEANNLRKIKAYNKKKGRISPTEGLPPGAT